MLVSFVVLQPHLQELSITADDSQMIIEVMGHARCKQPHRFHLLGLQEFGLQLALFGEVQLHAENTFPLANPDQGAEVKADMLVSGRIFEFDLHVLDGTFCPETAVKSVPLFLGVP